MPGVLRVPDPMTEFDIDTAVRRLFDALRKADPGMPSSHANSLAFLGVCAAVGLDRAGQRAAAVGVLALAVALVSVFF